MFEHGYHFDENVIEFYEDKCKELDKPWVIVGPALIKVPHLTKAAQDKRSLFVWIGEATKVV